MENKEVIQGEKQALYAERAYLVLSEVTKRLLTAWLPVFMGGILGTIVGWVLPFLLKPLARELAREANWFRIDYLEEAKLKAYNGQRDALRALESLYTGGALTPEEKKANESFDKSADDLLDWPE